MMLSYANTQVIVLIFVNFTDILSKIHKALALLASRPHPEAQKSARLPELLEWASPNPF